MILEGYGPSADSIVEELASKPLQDVLEYLIFTFWTSYDRFIYECESCGRLWLETDAIHYAPYLPETDERHLLRSRRHHNPSNDVDE